RIQLVTVRRPRARIAPRKSRTSRGAERGSRADASRENQWHGPGVGCEDVMAGSVRGTGAGLATAIVPDGPALVYPPRVTPHIRKSRKLQSICTLGSGRVQPQEAQSCVPICSRVTAVTTDPRSAAERALRELLRSLAELPTPPVLRVADADGR